ncbi:MAG: endopeptidase La [Paludibacteraceae bacterium]|nr:endopeptidase La [Paludibacteraceae bacterium]
MVFRLGEDNIEDIYEEDVDGNELIPILGGNDVEKTIELNDGDWLGVLPLKNMVLFPGVLLNVTVTRPLSQRMVVTAYNHDKLLAVLCQKKRDIKEPKDTDLYTLGTAARVIRALQMPDNSLMIILEGIDRVEVDEFSVTKQNMIKARVHVKNEVFPSRGDKEFLAVVSTIKEQGLRVVQQGESQSLDAAMTLRSISNPPTLVNYICVNFGIQIAEKQKLLATNTIAERALRLLEILNKEVQMLEMKAEIQSKTKEEIDKDQREYYLHHQLETIQKELGDTGQEVIKEMTKRAKTKHWPESVSHTFEQELKKLQRTPTHSPDYTIQQNFLDTLLNLPWNEYTDDNYDIKHAQQVLDNDHYGMDKVKERIVEYLAVQRQLHMAAAEDSKKKKTDTKRIKSPILCLYGPPGVGKTSLGKSVAEALGRKYARISLGGLHDEAEIRGHRKTYIGAMPGRIIENIMKVKSSNPVFVLDEIDKIGADYKGDPTSALLEVLDPEQNATFHDNYLDIDYDLSKVLFIATANTLETIPRPLLDRMELIEMTGYSIEEKEEIAKRHLIPKVLENHGLTSKQIKFNKEVIDHLIDDYTRESGVRSLERQIASVCRKIVTHIALDEPYNISVTPKDLIDYLGQAKYTRDAYETNKYIGVVTGLAWTQVGGEILFIETSLSPAKQPTLTMTGNLGDVMKESATIALGYIKAHADQFGISKKDIDTHAVHIHVPEGAIPKDGPSAGITMTTALVSAFTKRRVRPRIAMTGEMTLRGKVLPIGGVKEKILAAKRAGITDLVLCENNRKDVAEIPEVYLKGLTFHYVRDIQEVIDFALM